MEITIMSDTKNFPNSLSDKLWSLLKTSFSSPSTNLFGMNIMEQLISPRMKNKQ